MRDLNQIDKFPNNAEEWFLKIQGAQLNAAQQGAFERWLDSEKNAIAFQEYERLWVLGDGITQSNNIQSWLIEAEQPTYRASKFSNMKMVYGLAACLVLLAVAFTFTYTFTHSPDDIAIEFSTAAGEQKTITLADGSTVLLNAHSSITTSYEKHIRKVTLNGGDAVFTVAKNTERPFVVDTESHSVRVLGTQFSLSRRNNQLDIAVIEGLVSLSTHGKKNAELTRLSKGQGLNVSPSGATTPMSPTDIRHAKAWLSGNLDFDNWTLAEAIAEHNRHASKKIVLQSNELQSVKISGVFSMGDTEAFVGALVSLLDVKVMEADNGYLIEK